MTLVNHIDLWSDTALERTCPSMSRCDPRQCCAVDFNHIQGEPLAIVLQTSHAARRCSVGLSPSGNWGTSPESGAGSFTGTSGTSEQISGSDFWCADSVCGVVAIASWPTRSASSGAIFTAARYLLVLNRFPTVGMQPQAFALGGGKDGLVIDSFYRYPHTQITEVLLPLVMARGGRREAECCEADYWVKKKLKVRKLGKEVDYATTPKTCMHWTRMVNGSNSFTCPFRIIFIISYLLNVRPCRFKRAEFHLRIASLYLPWFDHVIEILLFCEELISFGNSFQL